MVHVGTFLLIWYSSLPFLDISLFFHNFEELRFFEFSLHSQVRFFLEELLFPSHFQISEKSLFLLHIELFNIPSLSLLCFISSLSSDSINLTLSICSFFLQISELLNFSFFLLFDSFFFHLMFKFSLLFFLDISHDCVIFLFFLNFLLLFHCLIKSVSCFNIYEHLSCSILLCSC